MPKELFIPNVLSKQLISSGDFKTLRLNIDDFVNIILISLSEVLFIYFSKLFFRGSWVYNLEKLFDFKISVAFAFSNWFMTIFIFL